MTHAPEESALKELQTMHNMYIVLFLLHYWVNKNEPHFCHLLWFLYQLLFVWCSQGDIGGQRTLQRKWTSFLKARLVCAIPDYELYFNVLRSVFVIEGSNVHDSVFYGVFGLEWWENSLRLDCKPVKVCVPFRIELQMPFKFQFSFWIWIMVANRMQNCN